jgi:two-component system, NarL family, sensor histidine kinase DesK
MVSPAGAAVVDAHCAILGDYMSQHVFSLSIRSRFRMFESWLRQRLLPPVLTPGAMPFFSLSYLVMLLLPLMLLGAKVRFEWLPTLASVILFLPAYFYFYWAHGWRRIGTLIVMALLGVALLPFNMFAHTYVVYSAVLAAFLPWRSMLGVFAFGQIAFLSCLSGMGIPLMQGLVMTVLSGGLAGLGNRVWLNYARKNVALRLSQEEMGRMAAMAERERIGRDLHDLLGHTLSVIALKSELAGRLITRDIDAAKREIIEVQNVARNALSEVRRAVSGMRSHGVLAECASARVALESAQVLFEYEADPITMSEEVESVLAFALREAATNVIRHAHAHRCRARLKRIGDQVRMEFEDDGRGGVKSEGNGIVGMRERLEEVGGTLELDSPVGGGTRLIVTVPIELPQPPGSGSESVERLRLVASR